MTGGVGSPLDDPLLMDRNLSKPVGPWLIDTAAYDALHTGVGTIAAAVDYFIVSSMICTATTLNILVTASRTAALGSLYMPLRR